MFYQTVFFGKWGLKYKRIKETRRRRMDNGKTKSGDYGIGEGDA
jgi:hypothetical protein